MLSNNTQQAKFKDSMNMIVDKENILIIKNGKKQQIKVASIDR